MCPRQVSDRGFGDIDPSLFKILAEQAADKDVIFYPQGFGESLLHPPFGAMLTSLRQLGVRYPVVISNATMLTEANCQMFIQAEPAVIIVSLDGAEPELYEQLRPNASYVKVVENIERLFKVRAQLGRTRPHIILSVVGMEGIPEKLEAFRKKWEPFLLPSDESFRCSVVSWAGTFDTVAAPPKVRSTSTETRSPCRMLYKTLTVYYDGRTTPCCYDHACRLEVGNAKTTSIADIWHGDELRRLRHLHETGRVNEIDLCRDCPDFIP